MNVLPTNGSLERWLLILAFVANIAVVIWHAGRITEQISSIDRRTQRIEELIDAFTKKGLGLEGSR